jgi:hypothetical protein
VFKLVLKPKNLFESELVFWTQFAPWRIERDGEIVCSSEDNSRPGGYMHEGVKAVLQKKVIDVKYLPVGNDVELYFEDGLIFRVFCQHSQRYSRYEHYYVIELYRNFQRKEYYMDFIMAKGRGKVSMVSYDYTEDLIWDDDV